MNDESKLCRCGATHAWGILRYSEDNVPLYGARQARNGCDDFREVIEGEENLPALANGELKALWAKTEFLNPQVPVATRYMVAKLLELKNFKEQWPEFMGLMVSQLTDVRGAMVREESKFAHLVAHTDEIVETMKAVTQLREQLTVSAQLQRATLERLERIEEKLLPKPDAEACAHFGMEVTDLLAPTEETSPMEWGELLQMAQVGGELRNEPVVGDVMSHDEN